MIQVTRYEHPEFTSNTYLIQIDDHEDAWLIDAGFVDEVLQIPGIKVQGVFLTHDHYDHIYGLNNLIIRFPEITIYGSKYTLDCIKDARKNLSFYRQMPVEVLHLNVHVLQDGDLIFLHHTEQILCMETPGHNPGCMSYIIDKLLFTGDSFIPGHPVITKLKGGNKELNAISLKKIEGLIVQGMHIYPGHKEIYSNPELHQLKPLE